jgi:hypothetical protein
VTVTQNKFAVISNLFTKDLVNPFQPIEFTLDGVTNPATIRPTDSFIILVYYSEGDDEVIKVSQGVTVTASPNTDISYNINTMTLETGSTNTLQFVI